VPPTVVLVKSEEIKKEKREGEDKRTFDEKFPYEIICSACGKPDRVSFNPDPNRPVYCKACLKIEKEKERQAKKNKNRQNQQPKSQQPKTNGVK
jgi:CxxC-x17-CxxC domain-containing protein